MKSKLSLINVTTTAAVMAFAFVLLASPAWAREAESGGGSSSSSGGGGAVSATPRADDNPSASDLIEGKRVLVPEVSKSNSIGDDKGLNSGMDSARDLFERTLRVGSKNDDVARLQKKLKDDGLFRANVTGFFGEITKKAVVEFQKKHGLPATGLVGTMTKNELNKQVKAKAPALNVTPEMQAKAGIVIHGGISGPGYPTGPLNMTVASAPLFLDREGVVNANGVADRQYQAPLIETIPPASANIPVTINGVANVATEVKVISNLRTKNGVSQHQGTIDVDIDTIPAGHVTLQYNGSATVVGSTITSKGTFKTSKVTGIFGGLVAEGNYDMTIVESGQTFGSPATVTITTVTP